MYYIFQLIASGSYIQIHKATHNTTTHHVLQSQFAARVKEKLGIDVPMDEKWYYKMCDYKPTLAYLYPEMFDLPNAHGAYKFWGYGDMDVIWGNIGRFPHYFDGRYTFIVSGWWGTTGAYSNSYVYVMCDCEYVPTIASNCQHIEQQLTTLQQVYNLTPQRYMTSNFNKSNIKQSSPPNQTITLPMTSPLTGAAAFYPNEPWTRALFLEDAQYVPLLKHFEYHNLDEGGTQCDHPVAAGDHRSASACR